ncbi:hypothetical protein [Cupriavidus metallidurans]|uniref:hypothetical protein n=1 Tax=Cupriavidus metallidurans TaxID=119219 RepID=UPI001319F19B|nr:hypothetical protein [Cupriavidus metallidurans]
MRTPARMEDLRHVDTGLSPAERDDARREGLRQKSIAALGDRWLLDQKHAPQRGTYDKHGVRVA